MLEWAISLVPNSVIAAHLTGSCPARPAHHVNPMLLIKAPRLSWHEVPNQDVIRRIFRCIGFSAQVSVKRSYLVVLSLTSVESAGVAGVAWSWAVPGRKPWQSHPVSLAWHFSPTILIRHDWSKARRGKGRGAAGRGGTALRAASYRILLLAGGNGNDRLADDKSET